MIKIENVEVNGWEAAIRGMRNPMNSWDKSDSYYDGHFCIGENDHDLMTRLAAGGSVHAKYRRYLDVFADINAPLYFWKEFKTYRKKMKFLDEEDFYSYSDDEMIGDFIEMNSCSTMHKIHSKEFELDDFSHDKLCVWRSENGGDLHSGMRGSLERTIKDLNYCRYNFLSTGDKMWWWQMVQLLPSSYNQKRTVKMNYEVLGAMYHWRKNHKLDEWREFCKWIESLPYSEIITGILKGEEKGDQQKT